MNGHVPGESSSITAAMNGNNKMNDDAMIAIFNLFLRCDEGCLVVDAKYFSKMFVISHEFSENRIICIYFF